MEYRLLGKSSLPVSEIGFGCMSLPTDSSAAAVLVHQAIELGINYFDTADIYQGGMNEEHLGRALKDRREDVIIASKVGNVQKAGGPGLDWNPSPEHIIRSVEKSLKRLQTDYIDLYQLHGGTMEDPIDDTIAAFETLASQGKIRYYGISSIRPPVIREWMLRSNMVSVMMQYSLLDRRPEAACLEELLEHNIGVLARGPVASGLLVDKPAKVYLDRSEYQVAHAAAAVKQVSNRERSRAQTALRFVLEHPAITSAITGIRTAGQLEEAAGLPSTPGLTAQELRILRDASPENFYQDA
ncbi:MAG: aldo/keto reductase [Chitinophagaceae bacterium]|nr:MAG: aldo/keto reductase [Chitinophagaceae bacterium]